MLAYSCFYVISQNYQGNSAEYNVAFFIHTMAKSIAKTVVMPVWVNQLVGFICQLASGFMQGHFMNFDRVNTHLKTIQMQSVQAVSSRDSK